MSTTAIENALTGALAVGAAPGLTAAARLADGSVWSGAYGQRGVNDSSYMTNDTVFWIASLTKALTSVAALQLIEQGLVSLEQPAADFIPAIAASEILEGFDSNGVPRLRSARAKVTVRHLLTHTSGYGYSFFSRDLTRYAEVKGLGPAAALELPRLFEAGERWQYGVSLDFVGQIVEKVTGRTLDLYLKDNVFVPLGMRDTSFMPSAEQGQRQAAMHSRLPDGAFAPIDVPMPPPPNPMLGGGGAYSTAEDYLIFLSALLRGGAGADGQRLLKPETMAFLTENQVGDLQCGVLEMSMPALSNAFEPMPDQPKRWTLGMMRNESPGPDGRSVGSLTWAGVSNCYCWADLRTGIAGVMLMQFLPFADPRALEAFAAFETAVYSA